MQGAPHRHIQIAAHTDRQSGRELQAGSNDAGDTVQRRGGVQQGLHGHQCRRGAEERHNGADGEERVFCDIESPDRGQGCEEPGSGEETGGLQDGELSLGRLWRSGSLHGDVFQEHWAGFRDSWALSVWPRRNTSGNFTTRYHSMLSLSLCPFFIYLCYYYTNRALPRQGLRSYFPFPSFYPLHPPRLTENSSQSLSTTEK